MSSILAWRSLFAPLVLTLALVFGVNYLAPMGSAKVQLNPPARGQDVYVLGNSMFGTGLDLDRLRAALPDQAVDFGYYNGHYTSMWYLAASVGMDRRSAPKTVVWGFRPTYAILPAFRQNKETDESAFALEAPQAYREILERAGDPTSSTASSDGEPDYVDQQVNFSGRASVEPFERYGAVLADLIKQPFDGMNGSVNVLAWLVDTSSATVEGAGFSAGVKDLDPSLGLRPTDRLIAYVTNGRIQRADALVVDNGDQFIQGETMPFDQSFIPPTTEAFERLGVRQVVVIFKPVRMFDGPLSAEAQAFYDDAKAYFRRKDILVIDLIADENVVRSFFASGDHYNQAGAEYVTDRIAEAVRGLR